MNLNPSLAFLSALERAKQEYTAAHTHLRKLEDEARRVLWQPYVGRYFEYHDDKQDVYVRVTHQDSEGHIHGVRAYIDKEGSVHIAKENLYYYQYAIQNATEISESAFISAGARLLKTSADLLNLLGRHGRPDDICG